MSFSTLPVIDLQADPDEIHQSLLVACRTTGFFYVSNHHLHSLQQQMFVLSKEFFHRPLSEKLTYSFDTNSYQGYLRIGHENLDSTNAQQIDQKEAFKIGQAGLNRREKLPEIFSRNENFQLIEKFFRACFDLCMRLFQHLADTLQIDRTYFTSKHQWDKEPGATLKCLHYPSTNKTNTMRAGAHSDYGSLTLLFQYENKSGLEVFDRLTNTWHPVPPRDDMIVVNFGDVFEYWSKGMIKSTIHRVNLPTGDQQNDARFSIAFFCDPNGDTRLTPIPSKLIENRIYTKDEHAQHIFNHDDQHILTAGEHLQMRLKQTHKY